MAATIVLAALSGCVSRPATRDPGNLVLAGARGELDRESSRAVVERMAADPENATVARMLERIGSLSEVPVYNHNSVELLIDGPATFHAMFSAIETAEHHIYVETFIFADDEMGRKFSNMLAEKSGQGVDVKVIYDSIGSFGSEEAMFKAMEEAGVEVIEFNDVNPIDGGNPLKLNHRDHRKLLIVDGSVAFTGGVNVSGVYSRSSSGKPKSDPLKTGWRDTHIAVRGPAVQGFEKVFVEHWRRHGREIDEPLPHPEGEAPGNAIVAILTAEGGDNEESAIFAAYVDAMEAATERIWLTQAYFAPDKAFLELLRQAGQRGVDVRLLTPGVSDSELVLSASRSRYSRLLKAGVRIFENCNDFLHAKTAVIDGFWSTVGSSNLDYRSFLHNDEINAIILGEEFGRKMEEQFERDLENSEEILLDEWRRRSLWQKFKEHFSWLLEYWL